MESSPTSTLFLGSILTSVFIFADKTLLSLSQKHKPLQLLRCVHNAAFFFLLRHLPYFSPSPENFDYPLKAGASACRADTYISVPGGGGDPGGDSGIGRALSQLLSIVNNIPVCSRKYEVVRALAERIIDENLREGAEPLRRVNCAVLSSAFSRTLNQLQETVVEQDRNRSGPRVDLMGGGRAQEGGGGGDFNKVNRVLRAVWYYGEVVWNRFVKSREERSRSGSSAEKLAAEVLWLAQKMAACRCAGEAVRKWASATQLASLAPSAEPRLQASLVKVAAFLFKQAKNLGLEDGEDGKDQLQGQTKMKMLMSWLPLLCRASNGTDAPVLSIRERAELEKVLEETIDGLEREEDQEKVRIEQPEPGYGDKPPFHAIKLITSQLKCLCKILNAFKGYSIKLAYGCLAPKKAVT